MKERLNGIQLIQKIRNGKIKDESIINVYLDTGFGGRHKIFDMKYKDGELEWDNGTFRASMLYDNTYDFVVEEDKRIDYPQIFKISDDEKYGDQAPNKDHLIDCNFIHLKKAIWQIIDEINKLKE